jgi:hypothetical protein
VGCHALQRARFTEPVVLRGQTIDRWTTGKGGFNAGFSRVTMAGPGVSRTAISALAFALANDAAAG